MNARPAGRALLDAARRGTLATLAADGRPRLVPVCFTAVEGDGGLVVWIPLDAKPKAVADPRSLARVRDIERDPRVSLLVDRWSEHWDELAWLRLEGRAGIVPAGGMPPAVVTALLGRYAQYASHGLDGRAAIRLVVERVVEWDAGAVPGAERAAEGGASGGGPGVDGGRTRDPS